jgi:hypothetical protein
MAFASALYPDVTLTVFCWEVHGDIAYGWRFEKGDVHECEPGDSGAGDPDGNAGRPCGLDDGKQ